LDSEPPSRRARRSEGSPTDRITFVGHATVLIEQQGVRLLTDPVLRNRIGPLTRSAPPADAGLTTPDAVIVSHLHRDHFDVPTLRALGYDTRLIVPPGAERVARRLGFRAITELAPGGTAEVGPLAVSAVAARHDGRRSPFGASAESVGYIVSGGSRVYFAGDTGLFDGMRDFAPGLDVALLPVWGWGPTLGEGHLGPGEAARALQLLRPRIAIPIHWGTLHPLGMRRLMSGRLSEPPREFASLAARVAPEVEVRILRPGESLPLVRSP
jgi:L-ascorbate metabolism protein UlaG (beta-lactamase superfamily)